MKFNAIIKYIGITNLCIADFLSVTIPKLQIGHFSM